MIKGIKLRGSDNSLNLILIDSIFHKVTPELVSFEMLLAKQDIPNIYCIGYSKPLKKLFIQLRNDIRAVYENVSVERWQLRHNYAKLNEYYSKEIKGTGFFQTEEYVKPLSNEYVLDAYNKLDYWKTITEGLWVTDQPDKVIDPDNLLRQLHF